MSKVLRGLQNPSWSDEPGDMVAERPQTGRVLLTLGAALLVTITLVACGTSSTASSPSPRPAVSVTAIPGFSGAGLKQDPAAYHAVAARVVEVFIKDESSQADKRAMAQRIAAMPEVEAYHFLTKQEALDQFVERFGKSIVANLPVNPLPAYFEILVRDAADVPAVAHRFYADPIVDNDPGTHNGVKAIDRRALPTAAPSP